MTTLRTITGTIDDTGAGTLRLRLVQAIVSGGAVVPAQTFEITYADDAPFSTAVPVPDSGTAHYIITFPNREAWTVYLSAGGSVDISTLIAATGLSIPDTAGAVTAAIAAHAALTSGVHGITAAGAALTTAADAAAQRSALGLAALFAPAIQPIGAVRSGGSALYGIPGLSGFAFTTRALISLRRYYMPFDVDRTIIVRAMQCEVTGTSAGLMRMGICRIGGDGQPLASGGVVVDAGEVDCSTLGVKTITGLSATLTPGAYAAIVHSNVTPTLRAIRAGKSTWMLDTWGVSGFLTTMRVTAAYAPFADPLLPWDITDATGNGFEFMVAMQWEVA